MPSLNHFISENGANLLLYPGRDRIYKDSKSHQYTIGDLHGNALKLLYTLIRLNILEMSADNYRTFVKLYTTPPEQLRNFDLMCLEGILHRAKVNNQHILRLLGDELCDRGLNDYFTLKIIEKLFNHKVRLEIISSNHNMDFAEALENTEYTKTNPAEYLTAPRLEGEFSRSLQGLKTLVTRGLVSEEKVKSIYNRCYKPYFRLISYSLKKDDITIYSHAAIGLEGIRGLAAKFKIPFQDQTAKALANTIDLINDYAQREYIQKNRISELYSNNDMFEGFCGNRIDPYKHPVAYNTWNREYQHLERPEKKYNYRMTFVHAHDIGEINHDNIYNLDNIFGKCDDLYQGNFEFLENTANPAPRTRYQFTKFVGLAKLFDNFKEFVSDTIDKVNSFFHPTTPVKAKPQVHSSTKKIATRLGYKPVVKNDETIPLLTRPNTPPPERTTLDPAVKPRDDVSVMSSRDDVNVIPNTTSSRSRDLIAGSTAGSRKTFD